MATPPNHGPEDARARRGKRSLNWGWVALGGSLVLLLVLSQYWLVLGLFLFDIQVRRVSDHTPEASEVVCHEVAPAVVARIEAGLTVPDARLRGARAVHAVRDGWLGFTAADEWFIAADVQDDRLYPGGRDIAVWRLKTRGDPRTGDGAPEAAIATVAVAPDGYPRSARDDDALAAGKGLARELSNFPPLDFSDSRPDLQDAAEACTAATLPTLPRVRCRPVAPAVVAHIEAGLNVSGAGLRGARAVVSDADPLLWVVAADLEGAGRYAGDDDLGVWAVRLRAAPPSWDELVESVTAVNGLAIQAGRFRLSSAEPRLVTAAVGCTNEALGGG